MKREKSHLKICNWYFDFLWNTFQFPIFQSITKIEQRKHVNKKTLFKVIYFKILYIFLIQEKLNYKRFKKWITSQSNIEISVFNNITFTDTDMVRDAIKSPKIEHYNQLPITDTIAKLRTIYHS